MRTQAFQVKFVIKRPKMKPVTCAGIVLAKTREEGVFEATKTIRETIDSFKDETTFKLLSAITIPNDFFIMHPKVLEETTKQVSEQ